MFRLQHLHKLRIVDRQDRAFVQLPEEDAKPESAYSQEVHDVEGADMKFNLSLCIVEVRLDEPEEVQEPHEDKPQSNGRQLATVAFQVAREHQRKWQNEMEANQSNADRLPAATQPVKIPADFVHHIARPDNEPLRE